jgi:hypothetical protein
MTRITLSSTPMPAFLMRLLVGIALGVWFGVPCEDPTHGAHSNSHEASVAQAPLSRAAGHAFEVATTGGWRDDRGHAPSTQCWRMDTVLISLAVSPKASHSR